MMKVLVVIQTNNYVSCMHEEFLTILYNFSNVGYLRILRFLLSHWGADAYSWRIKAKELLNDWVAWEEV